MGVDAIFSYPASLRAAAVQSTAESHARAVRLSGLCTADRFCNSEAVLALVYVYVRALEASKRL